MNEFSSAWPELIRDRLRESAEVKLRLLADAERLATIEAMAVALAGAVNAGHKVLVFGNGGSAADAQHLAAELLGRFMLERESIPAIALADSSAAVTAIGNDYAYAQVFSRQLAGLGAAGDVALGISTSGTSPNVVRAIETARQKGMVTMALTGDRPGPLCELADHCLRVPTEETARIQECYMTVAHTLCELVEITVAASALV